MFLKNLKADEVAQVAVSWQSIPGVDCSFKVTPSVKNVKLADLDLAKTEVILVTNPEVRADIAKAAGGQAQITDGSHLIVFAAWDNYTDARIDAVTDLVTKERGEIPMANEYYANLKANYVPRDAEVNYAHAARQAYIALGVALVAAAEQEVDSTPMEGFDPSQVDKILGLKERGLRSVVLMPLGYRDPSADWLLPMKKVRKSRDTLVTLID